MQTRRMRPTPPTAPWAVPPTAPCSTTGAADQCQLTILTAPWGVPIEADHKQHRWGQKVRRGAQEHAAERPPEGVQPSPGASQPTWMPPQSRLSLVQSRKEGPAWHGMSCAGLRPIC